jgi:hypothetical protein
MMLATIRLFKAVPVDNNVRGKDFLPFEIYRRTLSKGFVFAPEVVASYGNIDALIAQVDEACGLDPNRLNKAFHKSFGKVQSASMEQLYLEQAAHYITTYGAEELGVFDAERVYIPSEQLDVSAIDIETFDFVVIRGMTYAEIKWALLDLLSSGVALSEQSIKDVLDAASLVGFTTDEIEQVRNREVKIALYELYGMVPANPIEFLRYVSYKATGSTLLIKSPAAIAALKQGAAEHNLVPIFNLYAGAHSLIPLGEIFLRFKPLFLALRANKELRPTINKIRRLAEKNHKPMPVDYLNNVTALIKGSKDSVFFAKSKDAVIGYGNFNLARLADELSDPNVTIFRKIRLANALAVRSHPELDSIVYKVRNGKSYATSCGPTDSLTASRFGVAYSVVMDSIVDSIQSKVHGRKIYIPSGVLYGLPSTEKQFIGNLPAGTSVQVPVDQALVAGVYWEDQGHNRIDLDLSVSNLEGKIGWDGGYRNDVGSVLFSGDNTSAPNGASEVFWFGPEANGSWMMDVNYYNFYEDVPVPYKIVVGTADAEQINHHFVIDPNRLAASASSVINVKQTNLGIVVADPDGSHRFFFSASNGGGMITSRYSEHAEKARKFMMASLYSAPTLNEVLGFAGAIAVDDPSEADEGFNLSPAAIDKTTILSLLS